MNIKSIINIDRNAINETSVTIGSLELYFSYDTIVAFRDEKSGLVVSENNWSKTTGKHLNHICDDHKIRIKREVFENKLL